jgi:hypothetical protein
MLILFSVFTERAGKTAAGTTPTAKTQSQQAFAVFSFFLFMIYGFFGLLLAVFRNDIIVEGIAQFV